MKKHLRKIALEKRASISPAKREVAAQKIAENFLEHIKIPPNPVVGIYLAFRDELSLEVLSARFLADGVQISAPSIDFDKKVQVFREYNTQTKLQKNRYGIIEPSVDAPVLEPTIVIIPMVAFDRQRNRLGYGGGYYDKYLENKDVLKVGVAFSSQEMDHIPSDPHDIRMDKIITEDFVL